MNISKHVHFSVEIAYHTIVYKFMLQKFMLILNFIKIKIKISINIISPIFMFSCN